MTEVEAVDSDRWEEGGSAQGRMRCSSVFALWELSESSEGGAVPN